MNKKYKLMLGIMALSVTSIYATDTLIGTEKDPVVTKSYVDKVIASLTVNNDKKELEARLSAQEKLISSLSQEIADFKEESGIYKIVTVKAGEKLYGKQGAEFIVRSGQGTVIASTSGGLQNVTQGVDLAEGQNAPLNHLMIIPREDGRGIEAVKNMVVMVRGGYSLSNE